MAARVKSEFCKLTFLKLEHKFYLNHLNKYHPNCVSLYHDRSKNRLNDNVACKKNDILIFCILILIIFLVTKNIMV